MIALLLLLASSLNSGTSTSNAVDRGDVINALESAIAEGEDDASLFFNLGNAYYLQGRYSLALRNYYSAELRVHRSDVHNNAQKARSMLKQKHGVELSKPEFSRMPWSSIAMISGLLLIIWQFYLVVFSRRHHVILPISLVVVVMLCIQYYGHRRAEYVIVVSAQASLHLDPELANELSTVFEGQVFEVQKHQDGKVMVKNDVGEAWIEGQSVLTID